MSETEHKEGESLAKQVESQGSTQGPQEKRNYLLDAWLVIGLGLVFGLSLAGVHAGLGPVIKQNKDNETAQKFGNLVEGAVQPDLTQVAVTLTGTAKDGKKPPEKTVYRALDAQNEQVGWVIPAKGQGFGGTIELLIGVDPQVTRITGIEVLSQLETPALGNKIEHDSWRKEFKGLDAAEEVEIYKKTQDRPDNGVEAITGATISSESVAAIVNGALDEWRGALRQAAGDWQPNGVEQIPADAAPGDRPRIPMGAE
jgi:electron transport complex protein RnfG